MDLEDLQTDPYWQFLCGEAQMALMTQALHWDFWA